MKRSLPVSLSRQITAILPLVSSGSDYFVTDSSRVALEPPPDATCRDYSLDIGKEQVIVCHFLKEVWDRKLVFARPHLFSYDIDDSQSRRSSQAVW